MNRTPIVGISMKIYKNNSSEMIEYAENLKDRTEEINDVDVFIFPSMGTLYPVSKVLEESNVNYGSQNIAPLENGAYTGELSIESLIDLGANYVEIGHFERRSIFNESEEMISDKVELAVNNNIKPIICIGELEKDTENNVKEYLKQQIKSSLSKINIDQINDVLFAYEPVWAIGKKDSAEHTYIHKIHSLIREILKELFGIEYTESVRLIYGGSVSSKNAEDILNSDDVDGVFVGRFGHDIDQFFKIINLAREKNN